MSRKRTFQPASPASPVADVSGRHGPRRQRTGSLSTEQMDMDELALNYDAEYEGNGCSIPFFCFCLMYLYEQ